MVKEIHIGTDRISTEIASEGVSEAFKYLKEQATDQNVNCTLEIGEIAHKINRRKIATNLFLIAQEAIKKAVIDGEAKNVKIALADKNEDLYLSVKDDGKEQHISENNDSNRREIFLMIFRADAIDGRLRIIRANTSDTYKTDVICIIPHKVLDN